MLDALSEQPAPGTISFFLHLGGIAGLAFALVALIMPLACRLALRRGFVDAPGGRKQHEGATPPIGGIVLFPVFIALALLLADSADGQWALYAALGLVLVTGVIDDYASVAAWIKFAVHFAAGFLVVLGGGASLENLGNLFAFGDVDFGAIGGAIFSVACVVYLINAINMMDGLDGLAGGKSLVILIWLLVACFLGAAPERAVELALLSGALIGFLLYNMRHPWRSRASAFLGDAGSMGLGVVLAWYCIQLGRGDDPVLAPISVAWIIALPIIDAFGLFAMRLREGRHPFDPDRRHLHHHFIHAGFPVGQSTLIILGLGGLLGGIGYLGVKLGLPVPVLGYGWVALWLLHAVLVMRPAPLIRLLSRIRGRSSLQARDAGHGEG